MERSYLLTGLLLIFAGPFGLHRFYTGYTAIGILYLLTGGLLGIGVLFDYIRFVQGEFDDANGEALSGYDPALGWAFIIIPILIFITYRLSAFARL